MTAAEPWPPDLIAKARRFLFRGYRYAAETDSLFDSETKTTVTRAELEAMTLDEAVARTATTGTAPVIGFRR